MHYFAFQQPRRILFIILTLCGLLLLSLPAICPAAPQSSAEELKQNAHQAYVNGRYAEAVALNLKIARKHPASPERRYAVQMLGTIYEDNLVDIKKAIKWQREFLERYANPRQVPFYQEKLASLEKLRQQKQDEAFAAYQAIKFANKGDEVMVKQFEELLAKHPDFMLKARVQKELGYAYVRLDKRLESYQALQALSRSGSADFSATDRISLEKARRHWLLTRVWGGIAWGVVVILWVAALFMKPWGRMNRAALRTFAIWGGLWLLFSAARLPTFYALKGKGDEVLFPDAAVYIAAGLNLAVLFWLWLLTRGKFWLNRPLALRWFSPPLTLLMTTAVFYLFMLYQPDGTKIIDAFAVKYRHWAEERQAQGRVQPSTTTEGATGMVKREPEERHGK